MLLQAALKRCILELLTSKGGNSELKLGFRFCSLLSCPRESFVDSGLRGLIALCRYARKPAVIMIVGVNGGGKTTSLGTQFAFIVDCAAFFQLDKLLSVGLT